MRGSEEFFGRGLDKIRTFNPQVWKQDFVGTVRSRRSSAIALALAASLVLAGCGFGAQTNQRYDAADGSNVEVGQVKILNAVFVDNGDDTATFSAALLNDTDSTKTMTAAKAKTKDGDAVDVSLAGPTKLKPGTLVATGKSSDIIAKTTDLRVGSYIKITLDIDGISPVTVNAPIVQRASFYDQVGNGPQEPPNKTATLPAASPKPAG